MKKLKDYITEKLNKNVLESQKDVTIPVFDEDDSEVKKGTEWKTFSFPDAEWFVFKDYYQSSSWHFASLGDMCGNFLFHEEDFEDFNPSKDILMFGNDYKDLIAKMLKKIANFDITKYGSASAATGAWEAEYEDRYWRKIHDNVSVLFQFYFGDDTPDYETPDDIFNMY